MSYIMETSTLRKCTYTRVYDGRNIDAERGLLLVLVADWQRIKKIEMSRSEMKQSPFIKQVSTLQVSDFEIRDLFEVDCSRSEKNVYLCIYLFSCVMCRSPKTFHSQTTVTAIVFRWKEIANSQRETLDYQPAAGRVYHVGSWINEGWQLVRCYWVTELR